MQTINLEEIILSKLNSIDFGSQPKYLNKIEIKDLMLEFGKQLLELAAKKTHKDFPNMVTRESIINTINQVE